VYKFLIFPTILLLGACSVIPLEEISDSDDRVRLYERYESVESCTFIDEIVGTEGHWYDYLFISNKNLTLGAVDDLKTEARNIKANAVHVHTNMNFNTSVTILGQAYDCSKLEVQIKDR
jgi:hypothetical protein